MTFIETPFIVQRIIIILFVFFLLISIWNTFISIIKNFRISLQIWSIALVITNFIYLLLFVLFEFKSSDVIDKVPLWTFIVAAAVIVIQLTIYFILIKNYSLNHLSEMSVKESFDKLPLGVSFYDEKGLPLLINEEMNELSIKIVGHALLNGLTFYDNLQNNKVLENVTIINEDALVVIFDDLVYTFKQYVHHINKKVVYELIATNITELYKLTKTYKEKNKTLEIINLRMKKYSENILEYTKEKEILNAKMSIHDQLGKLLLITKKRLNEPTSLDVNELVNEWNQILDIFLYKEEKNVNNVDLLINVGKDVGVDIKIKGNVFESGSVNEKILLVAIHECLTNTVSHAKGKNMQVEIISSNTSFIITITNDGFPPQHKITEGGGLSALRTIVEREHGVMIIKSLPKFKLEIKLLKEQDDE